MQYAALGSASFSLSAGLFNQKPSEAFFSSSMNEKQNYDWIFLYWMPYDNDLSGLGNPILEMLKKGVQSDNILVVVESKLRRAEHLSRHLISQNKVNTQELEVSNSASEEVFAEYLTWARSKFEARKWAIVILGHGGRLDEISPDEHPAPGSSSATQWINIQKLSDVITDFNQQVNERVELFFFQNCNKGTIEANYTVCDAAKYTLSSQVLLGAPNYYYEPLLQFVGRNPNLNGGQLAEKIMEFEPSDMYHSYTAVDNRAVHRLPEKINPLIESVLASNIKAIKIDELSNYEYEYMGDRFVDGLRFLEFIVKQSGADLQKYNDFVDLFKNSVIYKLKSGGTLLINRSRHPIGPMYQNLSGLGIFLPHDKQELEKYRYLKVFSELKLAKLFDAILAS